MEPSKTGEWIGDCEVLEPVAVGAHGEIVLARTGGEGGELVAVKRLLPELLQKKEAVTAFHDEIRLCTRLVHPNIVRVYRSDVHNGQPFIVMEFVDGVTLWELLEEARDRGVPIPIPVAVHVATMIGEALDYAHTLRDEKHRPLRLVHRDVSSVNVMVSFDGAVKLLDFGIARSTIREHETAPGIIRGKPQYLSPEQCGQGEIDHLTDIYSLGIVLFEMLAGERPYIDDDVYNLIRRILRGDRDALGELRPAVDPDLEEIVDRAIAVARDERYGSARQLVRDLREYTEGNPSPGSTSRLAELVRALFPIARLEEVADRYGPPEVTAVDTVLPEAREPVEATKVEVALPGVHPFDTEENAPGLLDPPTHQDVVAHAAAVVRRGGAVIDEPPSLLEGTDGVEDETTEVLPFVAAASAMPSRGDHGASHEEAPADHASTEALPEWPTDPPEVEEDGAYAPTSPDALPPVSSVAADEPLGDGGPSTPTEQGGGEPAEAAPTPDRGAAVRTGDIPPAPPTRTADVDGRPPDWAATGRPAPWWSSPRARLWIAVVAAVAVVGGLAGVIIGTCESEAPAPPAEPLAELAFEIVDAAAPQAPPAEPETGTLVVKVRPSGAVVAVGEERVQAEDGVARLELGVGAHSIRVRARGYRHANRDVQIQGGEPTEIEVALERRYGRLSVRTRHKATVYVDGDAVGSTPLRRHKVPAGVHTVKVKSRRGQKQRRVRVLAGRHRMVRFPL